MMKVWAGAVGWLAPVLAAVQLPGAAGSEAACAAARQQLMQLQGRLQQDLQDAVGKLGAGSSSIGSGEQTAGQPWVDDDALATIVAAALPSIAQQMVVFGHALCTQVPLPYCCNNPGCTELRGASELQLVGGKGCVCARCRWVFDEL
jgi:hypothetical protein